MLPVCLRPMEDELLYGWLLRLANVNGCTSVEELKFRWFTDHYKDPVKRQYGSKRIDILPETGRICKLHESLDCFPMPDEIAGKMTPLYAVFPFMLYGHQGRWMQFLLRDKRAFDLGENGQATLFDGLHFCPECMDEDKKRLGFPYIRTWHHVPGVKMCAVHGISLREIKQRNCRHVDIEKLTGGACEMKLTGELRTEKRIACFAKNLYDKPPFFDLKGLQQILSNKMVEDGYGTSPPYEHLKVALDQEGYLSYFQENIASRVRLLLTNSWVNAETILAFTSFLFPEFERFEKQAEYFTNRLEEPFCELAQKNYDILSSFGPVVKLGCRVCGSHFWIHPYALAIGCQCPDCETRLSGKQIAENRLKFLGDGNYELLDIGESGTGKVKLLHRTCGKIRTVKLAETLWLGKRCKCECRTTEDCLREETQAYGFALVNYIREDNRNVLELRHLQCGREFLVDVRQFRRNKKCPYCEYSIPYSYTLEEFKKAVQELVGDKYILKGTYVDKHTKTAFLHKECGTVTEMTPEEFLTGKRCKLCKTTYSRKEIETAVADCTQGYYQVVALENSYYEIEGADGGRFSKKAAYIVQELERPTPSPFFKMRTKCLIRKKGLGILLYRSVKEASANRGFWQLKDFKEDGFSKRGTKKALERLTKAGYLKKTGHGKYTLGI